jgi:hypothetical protein
MGVQIRKIDVQNWTYQRVIQIFSFSQPICAHSRLVAGVRRMTGYPEVPKRCGSVRVGDDPLGTQKGASFPLDERIGLFSPTESSLSRS